MSPTIQAKAAFAVDPPVAFWLAATCTRQLEAIFEGRSINMPALCSLCHLGACGHMSTWLTLANSCQHWFKLTALIASRIIDLYSFGSTPIPTLLHHHHHASGVISPALPTPFSTPAARLEHSESFDFSVSALCSAFADIARQTPFDGTIA